MSNPYFKFKQFTIFHDKCGMKVNTDGVLLGAWADIKNVFKVLDIGSGCGVIALILAERSQSIIHAVEIEKDAYEQSLINIKNSKWAEKISVFNDSFQEFYIKTEDTYDLIVSNPPFFNNSLTSKSEKRTLARHSDSLQYDEMLKGVKKLLNKNGRFCLILPYKEAEIFITKAKNYSLYPYSILQIKNTLNQTFFRVLLEFRASDIKTEYDTLIIYDEIKKDFSEEYKMLTKDFYLNF